MVRITTLVFILVLSSALPALAHGGAWKRPPRLGEPLPDGGLPPGWKKPPPPSGRAKGPATPGVPAYYDWNRWWGLNREWILDLPGLRRSRREALRSGSDDPAAAARERDAAARLAAEITRALLAAAIESDPDVATGAIIALGRGRSPEAFPVLAKLLRDAGADPTVRESAALALGMIRGRVAETRALLAGLLEKNPETPLRLRGFAALGLGLTGDQAAVPALLAAVASAGKDTAVSSAAALSLGLLGEEMALADLQVATQPAVKAHAAFAFGAIGGEEAVGALVKATEHRDPDVRRQAALSLGRAKAGPGALMKLMEQDDDPLTRAFSAVGLAEIGGTAAGRAVKSAYRRGDMVLAPHAAIALGMLSKGEEGGFRVFLRSQLREHRDPDLSAALAAAVAAAGDGESTGLLLEILEDEDDPQLRGHVAVALSVLGARQAVPIIRKTLEEAKDPGLLREAAFALSLFADRGSREILLKLLESADADELRGEAAVALGRLGEPGARELLALLGDIKVRNIVRAFAAVGLGVHLMGDREAVLGRFGAHLNHAMARGAVEEVLSFF